MLRTRLFEITTDIRITYLRVRCQAIAPLDLSVAHRARIGVLFLIKMIEDRHWDLIMAKAFLVNVRVLLLQCYLFYPILLQQDHLNDNVNFDCYWKKIHFLTGNFHFILSTYT